MTTKPTILMIIGVSLAGLVLAGLWAWNLPAAKQLLAQATSRQPEQFTELYFTDPALPKTLTAGREYQRSFTLVNHHGSPKTYTYQVQLTDGGHTRLSSPVVVTLNDGQRSDQAFTFRADTAGRQILVVVTLLGEQQSIYFRAGS